MSDVREVYEMVTKQKPPEPGALERQQKRQVRAARNRRLGGWAVAAAIGVTAVAVFLGTRVAEDRSVPAGEPTVDPRQASAVRVAEGFLSAFGNFDAETASSYLANDDVIADLVSIPGVSGTDALAMDLAMLEAMGYEQIAGRCDATTVDDDTSVTCPYDFHAIRSNEIGLGPYGGSTFTFTIRDGAIVRVDAGLNFLDAFSPEMWEPFAAWLSETYPDDAAVMYVDATLTDYALTEESIRLWGKRTREYVDVALSEPIAVAERFMEARNAHDAQEAMSLIGDEGASVRLLHDNRPAVGMPTARMDRDELALALEAERIYAVTYESVECGPAESPVGGGEAQIECSFTMDNRLRQVAGLPPLETSLHVGVHDGRVTFLSFPWLNAGFPGSVPSEAWLFIEWLQREHPEVGAPMEDGTLFHTGGQELTLNLTPQALQLLETYLDEYEAAQGA